MKRIVLGSLLILVGTGLILVGLLGVSVDSRLILLWFVGMLMSIVGSVMLAEAYTNRKHAKSK